MNRKPVVTVAVITTLFASALYALSYVSATGRVYSKETILSTVTYSCGQAEICTATTIVKTLKIERADGTKVNADCLVSDAIRSECDDALPGDLADGLARCDSGWCSWIKLDVTSSGG